MSDPNEINHPLVAPGFYPNGHKWNTATLLDNVCGLSLTKDIDIEEALNFNGDNTLTGTVWYDPTGKTETDEDPIPLIDVVVEKTPPGQAQGRATTNGSGEYGFNLVPNSDTIYTLYVSMPGIPVTSTYEILANTGGETYCELDFCLNIDSTVLVACNPEALLCEAGVITGDSHSGNDGFKLYPNPSNGRFTIETGNFAETDTEVLITDLSGRIVFRKRYNESPSFITLVNIVDGFYLVRLSNRVDSDALPLSVLRQ
jgi:hypothetical protein